MPRNKRDRVPLQPLPSSILSLLQEVQRDFVDSIELCQKFDRGQNVSGKRLRAQLAMIRKKLQYIREEIQRVRYYRDALKIHAGKKTFTSAAEYKEAKYGTVNEVAEFQIAQKHKGLFKQGD